jgi:hypothetical protein
MPPPTAAPPLSPSTPAFLCTVPSAAHAPPLLGSGARALPLPSPPLPALFATSCPSVLPPDLQAIAALVSSSSSSSSSSPSSSPPSAAAPRKRPLPLRPVAQANLYRDHAASTASPPSPSAATQLTTAAAAAAPAAATAAAAAAAAHPQRRKKRRPCAQGELQVRMALM